MAKSRKKVITSATRSEAETAMLELANINSQLKRIESKKEIEKQKIDDKYKDEVVKLQSQTDMPKEILEVWAKEDCKNWEGKSYDLAGGTVAFRTNPPKVEKSKNFTWDGVLQLFSKYFPHLVRKKEELNKEAIIALRDDKNFEKIKEKCFIDVVQDEQFTIITKEE